MKFFLTILFALFFFAETHLPGTVTVGDQTITSSSTTVSATITTTNGATDTVEWSKFPLSGLHLKVGVIGSSTDRGGLGTTNIDSGWAQRFFHYYKALGIVDTLYNLSVDGTDYRYGLPTNGPPSRVGFPVGVDTIHNVTALTKRHCDVILVGYSTNDYLTTQMSLANMALYGQLIYDTAVASGAVCYMLGTQPRPGYDADSKALLIVRNDTLRNRFKDNFIDKYDLLSDPNNRLTFKHEYAYTDSIHGNDLSHRRAFELIRSKNVFRTFATTNTSTIASPKATSTSISGIPMGTTKYHIGVFDSWGMAWDTTFSITRNEDEGGGEFTPTTGLLKFYGRLKIKQ